MTGIPQDSDLHDGDHTVHGLRKEIARGFWKVRDYGGSNSVTISGDVNAKAKEDGIFILQIGDKKAYVNKEEMLKALRFA